MHKNEKLDYYIFQFKGTETYLELMEYIDFSKTEFIHTISKERLSFNSFKDFRNEREKIFDKYWEEKEKRKKEMEEKYENDEDEDFDEEEEKIEKPEILLKKIVLNKELDFYPILEIAGHFYIASERLKMLSKRTALRASSSQNLSMTSSSSHKLLNRIKKL